MAVFAQLVEERLGGVDVEDAGLQRHDDLVGHLEHIFQGAAVQACGRVEHRVRGALGRLGQGIHIGVPPADGGHGGGAQAQPQVGRFLGVHIAQDDRMPLAGVVTRHVCRKGGLAHTPLGIGNNNHWHVDLLAKKITNKNRC